MNCLEVLDNIVAFVQGEITDDSLRRDVAAHIQACGRCRREEGEVRRCLEVMCEAGEPFVPSNRVWTGLLERIRVIKAGLASGDRADAPDTAAATEPQQARTPRLVARAGTVSRPRRVVAFAASIAAVAVIVAAVLIIWNSLGRFSIEYVKGSDLALIYDDGKEEKVEIGHRFVVGNRMEVRPSGKGDSILRYSGGSTLALEEGADLEIAKENEVYLHRGTLHADITSEGLGFVVQTDFGRAEVTGTIFTICVDDEKTLLRVKEGVVEFTNSGTTRRVAAGLQTAASASREPVLPYPAHNEAAPVPEITGLHKVELVMAVLDSETGRYVSQAEGREVVLKEGDDLFVSFRIRNNENFALRMPGGTTLHRIFIRYSRKADRAAEGTLVDLTSLLGKFVEGEEHPRLGSDGFVVIDSGRSYRFVYRLDPGTVGLEPGKTAYILGGYLGFCTSRTPLVVRMPPPGGDAEQVPAPPGENR